MAPSSVPLLLGAFGFAALAAVIVNNAMAWSK